MEKSKAKAKSEIGGNTSQTLLSNRVTKIAVTALLTFAVLMASALGVIMFVTYENQRKATDEQIRSAVKLYASDLSEKISVIASSDLFLDYLRSGKVTRKNIETEFEFLVGNLISDDVVGLIVYDRYLNPIFRLANSSPSYIKVKMCYLGRVLNAQLGGCSGYVQLYFNISALGNKLRESNPKIITCEECKKYTLASSGYLGAFEVSEATNVSLGAQIPAPEWYILPFVGVSFLVIFVLFGLWLSKQIRRTFEILLLNPIENMVKKIRNNNEISISELPLEELRYLGTQINIWKIELKDAEKAEKELAVAALARQVAHDIRSPITALNVVVSASEKLPEIQRNLMRGATLRIQDIANNLLESTKPDQAQGTGEKSNSKFVQSSEKQSICLVACIVDSIISEKRAQLGRSSRILIERQDDLPSYGLFSNIQPNELKRVLSNLINNSIEAFSEEGKICITIIRDGAHVKLSVTDNGRGVPSAWLPQLAQKGATFGKAQGSGLGLFHARKTIESWGGKLLIDSVNGEGTTVTLFFKMANPPEWFVPEIVVSDGSTIVVLDDDESVFNVWKSRFQQAGERGDNIELLHFQSPIKLREWQHSVSDSAQLYLIDYEIIGHEETGLDMIEELNIHSCSILVTSYYEETNIVLKCKLGGAGLLPKQLASSIPISVRQTDLVEKDEIGTNAIKIRDKDLQI